MRIGALLADTTSYAGRLVVLALIPLATSLSRVDDVLALGARPGFRVSVTFGTPHPLADLWTFVDPPRPEGGGLHVDAPFVVWSEPTANTPVTALAYVVGSGLLAAGYVGSIDQFVETGRYNFLGNVGTYGGRMVGYQAVVFAGVLVVGGAALSHPGLLFVAIPAGLVAWVLFFMTPYLVVIEDRPLVEAFERSPRLATGGVEPLAFVAVYAVIVAAGSLPLSLLVAGGLPGVLLAAGIASVSGVLLTTFTTLFVRELVGAGDGSPVTDGSGEASPN
jgi:hypothetical protein